MSNKYLKYIVLLTLCTMLLGIKAFAQSDLPQTIEPAQTETQAAEEEPAVSSMQLATEVKAFWITQGKDYALSSADSEQTIKSTIDSIMNDANKYGFNTVFVPLEGDDGVIYSSPELQSAAGFDMFEYILASGKAAGLSVFPVFSANAVMQEEEFAFSPQLTSELRTQAALNIESFIKLYDVDAIFLDGYQNYVSQDSMALYRAEGGGMGFDNWIREASTSLVTSLSDVVKSTRPDVGIGLVTAPVWANASTIEGGSNTNSEKEMFTDGNVDIDLLLEQAPVEAIVVNAPGSLTDEALAFEEVMTWWAQKGAEHDVPAIALINNQNLGSEAAGWASPDQVMRQVIATREIDNVTGAAFFSYESLENDFENSTEILIQYYNNMVNAADILTDLAVSRPEELEYTTFEPQVSFYGASDPNFALTLNGNEVERNEKGVFSMAVDLNPGINTFTFAHKDKEVVYNITRQVQILSSVTPVGAVTVEGSTRLTFNAIAYADSTVTATINGRTVTLEPAQVLTDETDRDSSYITYTGTYTVPAGQQTARPLGNINFTANWQGIEETMQGAEVTVAAVAQAPTGNVVMVTTDQARTYPSTVLNADPWGDAFPLPAGTLDFVVSDLLTYQEGDEIHNYYKLASGHRIDASDVATQGFMESLDSTVSAATFTADSNYIYLTVTPSVRTPYVASLNPLSFSNEQGVAGFTSTSFNILLKYSTLGEGVAPLVTENTIFSAVTMTQQDEDVLVTMQLARTGGFNGMIAYYDGSGNLVFRFNQKPTSLSEARVYIDPGHGGTDPGAIPIPGLKSEKDLNYEMAVKVADILTANGIEVRMTDTTSINPTLDERREAARDFSPNLFVSLHHNASTSPSAVGTEVWYFNPYSHDIASSLSQNIAVALGTTNRGAKYGWYRVISHMEFPGVLVEYGFLSNPTEYEKLRTVEYQDAMAQATANAIIAALS